MPEHSILSPSSFPRLVACPGSRKLEAMFPREESEAAAEGILAHELCSSYLKGWQDNKYNSIENIERFTIEMHEAMHVYVRHISEVIGCKNEFTPENVENNNFLIKRVHIEERIDIPYLHHECFGTPDCWYYDEEKNEVHVWDFKYGFKPVEVRENWQLIGYACGVIDRLIGDLRKISPLACIMTFERLLTINLHIVQPRSRHRDGAIRTWSLTRDALISYEDILKARIEDSFNNPYLSVGSHCTYCKAKSICPQLKKESNMIVDKGLEIERELKSSKIYIPDPKADHYQEEINAVEEYIDTVVRGDRSKVFIEEFPLNQEIIDTRRSIEILKLRLETLEKQALEEIKEGKEVSGFTAKKVWGRLGWNIPAKDVQMLGNELGLNLVKPAKTEVITPLQAIKLAKKDEAVKERIKSLSSCKFNGYKLVAEGDSIEDEEVSFDDL